MKEQRLNDLLDLRYNIRDVKNNELELCIIDLLISALYE